MLQITRLDSCDVCHGTGAVGPPQTCPTCNGTGQIQQAAGKMRFNVPCNRCGGTGKLRTACKNGGGGGGVRANETIGVGIPPGGGKSGGGGGPGKREDRNLRGPAGGAQNPPVRGRP